MSGTFRAASGILLSSNSRVYVVVMVVLLDVPRVWFFSCMVEFLQTVLRPMREIDASVSKEAVFLFTFGGLVQPEGYSLQKMFVI